MAHLPQPVSKAFRQEQILKLIRSRPFHSQSELAEALRENGVETTQVTLSRDLKELALVKTPAGYAEMETAPASSSMQDLVHILQNFVRDIRRAQNLLVLKTDPGAAQTVAVTLDSEEWDELVGSLAGDDTVLLICEDDRHSRTVEKKLRELIAV